MKIKALEFAKVTSNGQMGEAERAGLETKEDAAALVKELREKRKVIIADNG